MHGKIFLTGATGFIGGELLKRLLRQDSRQVVCLVRAQSPRAAQQRGEDTLRRLGVPTSLWDQATWLPGDVLQERLGLSRQVFRLVADELEEIFHCAASTDFDLPLEEAYEINVRGVRRVCALAELARDHGVPFRRLNQVSTAYVAGRHKGDSNAQRLPDDDPANFRNTYERTKAAAERMLQAKMDSLPISIYRPSIVVGDTQTGYTSNWNVVYFPMRLMATGKLRFAPRGGGAYLDCVPVDYVVDAILALAGQEDTRGETFNLSAGDDALTVMDVIRHTYAGMARKSGEPTPAQTTALRPLAWWCVSNMVRMTCGPKVRKAIDGFAVYEEYCKVDTVLECRRERARLQALGVSWTPSQTFFEVVVDFALEQRFGRRARLQKTPRRASARLAEALQSASGALAEALQSGTGTLGSVGA